MTPLNTTPTGIAPTAFAVIFNWFVEPNLQRPIQDGAALDEISRACFGLT